MSKKHKNKHQEGELVKPASLEKNGLVATFGEKMGKDFKDVNDLMNWIIFGDDKHFYETTRHN